MTQKIVFMGHEYTFLLWPRIYNLRTDRSPRPVACTDATPLFSNGTIFRLSQRYEQIRNSAARVSTTTHGTFSVNTQCVPLITKDKQMYMSAQHQHTQHKYPSPRPSLHRHPAPREITEVSKIPAGDQFQLSRSTATTSQLPIPGPKILGWANYQSIPPRRVKYLAHLNIKTVWYKPTCCFELDATLPPFFATRDCHRLVQRPQASVPRDKLPANRCRLYILIHSSCDEKHFDGEKPRSHIETRYVYSLIHSVCDEKKFGHEMPRSQ